MGRKAEQSEATRAAIMEAAKDLFSTRGYAETPLEEVVQRAGVTRGALYHHFRDKGDLFMAVHLQVVDWMQGRVIASMKGKDAWQRLKSGINGFLDICMDPVVQRICFVDMPSVGTDHPSHHDTHGGQKDLTLMVAGLDAAIEEGFIEPQPTVPMAQVLLAACGQAGITIANAEDKKKARAEFGTALDRLLEGLRREPTQV
jgi:AcrR family transcriptional regulator